KESNTSNSPDAAPLVGFGLTASRVLGTSQPSVRARVRRDAGGRVPRPCRRRWSRSLPRPAPLPSGHQIHATDRNEWVLPARGRARQDPSIEERAVKRTVTYAAGVLILGVAVYAGSRLWAQNTSGAARPAPTTRIALINLPYVIKNY